MQCVKARWRFEDWHKGASRFRCLVCKPRVSARLGTAYADIRTEELTYRYAVTALAEGVALRATGRLFVLDQDTLGGWLPRLSVPCPAVRRSFFRDLHLPEGQLDERGTVIYQKEEHLDPVEQLLDD